MPIISRKTTRNPTKGSQRNINELLIYQWIECAWLAWLMAHGSRHLHFRSRLMALSWWTRKRGHWAQLVRAPSRSFFLGHEQWALRHESWGLKHETWGMNNWTSLIPWSIYQKSRKCMFGNSHRYGSSFSDCSCLDFQVFDYWGWCLNDAEELLPRIKIGNATDENINLENSSRWRNLTHTYHVSEHLRCLPKLTNFSKQRLRFRGSYLPCNTWPCMPGFVSLST